MPVFEQAARDTGNTGIIGSAPRIDARTHFIDTIERLSAARVIAHIENFVAGRPALLHLRQAAVTRLPPVLRRRCVGRVNDQ